MSQSGDGAQVREVRDVYARRYRVGESDGELLGRSRSWMIRLAWLSMMAISVFQYGFGAAVLVLTRRNHWSLWEACAVLTVCVVVQASVSLPVARLYQRIGSNLVAPMLVAATLCLAALVTLAHVRSLAGVLLGYSVLGGIGAGLVYMTCIGAVTEWFPERLATGVGVVSGAFGYGALPFILLAAYTFGVDNLAVGLDAIAVGVFLVVAVSGVLMRKPPRNWWPAHIDPQRWAIDRRLNRSIPNNVPALRAYPPYAAFRTGMLPMMFVIVVLTAAMAFFDIVYLVGFVWFKGAPPLLVAASIGMLALSTGVGRAVTGTLSDRLGRRRTLGLAMALGGVAQFGLLAAVHGDYTIAVVLFAAVAGAGTGAGYSLLVSMVRDWFGNEATLPNYGVVYTGKAVGSVLGLGLAALAVAAPNSAVAVVVVGLLGLSGAVLTRALRQPGRPVLPLPGT